ncbi:MAG: IS110 family transposase [Fidelibacterota bacterium]
MFFCGIDWSDNGFIAVIVDPLGKVVKKFIVRNSADEFDKFIDKIRIVTSNVSDMLFAIETPNLAIVDYLMENGYTVYPINPKSVDRYRDRYRVSGAKDDFFDAFVLANIIRTDMDHHQPLSNGSDLARELKILTQDREKFVKTKTKMTNQLRSCLKACYPEVCDLFDDLSSPSALTFLITFPTWEDLKKKSQKQLIQFLKKRKITHPVLLKKIIEHTHTPPIPIDPVVKKAKVRQMLTLVKQLISLCRQIKEYDQEIKQLLDKHEDKDIFLSLPGAAENLASRLLSQFGDDRSRFQSVSELRPMAGTAPVTKQSGKYKYVIFRFSCRKPFRNALQLFSFSSLTKCKWAALYYEKHREMGKTHHHALRLLSDKWIKIIFAMWQNHHEYDENKFLADKLKHMMDQPNNNPVLEYA